MSYYWFNRQELLEKAKERYHSGGAKEKAINKYKNLSEKEKEAKKKYGRNRYKNMKENGSQKNVKKIKY